MSEEKKQQIRVTTEEAFHGVAVALEKVSLRIDHHTTRIDHLLETVGAQATLIDCAIKDVKSLRDRLDTQAKEIATLREMVLPQQVN